MKREAFDKNGLKITVGATVTMTVRIQNPNYATETLRPWIRVERKGVVESILANGVVSIFVLSAAQMIRRAGNKLTVSRTVTL